MNSPEQRFIPIQSKLAKSDKMNEYVRYESSSIFACPPGTTGAVTVEGEGFSDEQVAAAVKEAGYTLKA